MSTILKNLQGWWLNHICGQPVPVLETLLVKKFCPNSQAKPTPRQFETISLCPFQQEPNASCSYNLFFGDFHPVWIPVIIHLDLANTCKVKHMFWFIMAFLISDYFFSTHSGGSITNFLTVLAFQCCKVPLCQAAQRSAACASWAKGGSCTLAVIMRKFVGGNFPN